MIAAGSPLGFENTISVGVVSSLNRPLRSESSAIFVDGIQTDAAINKGNSGGALCDASGRLIGINTAIATTDEGSIGIGFSIPINRARVVVADIVKLGYVRYGETGIELHHVSGILAIPRARQELMRIVGTTDQPPKSGALIDRIDPGSAAQEAGLHQLDVITKINGKAIDQNADFLVAVSNKKPGDHLELTIWSRGEIKTVTLTLKGTHQNGQ